MSTRAALPKNWWGWAYFLMSALIPSVRDSKTHSFEHKRRDKAHTQAAFSSATKKALRMCWGFRFLFQHHGQRTRVGFECAFRTTDSNRTYERTVKADRTQKCCTSEPSPSTNIGGNSRLSHTNNTEVRLKLLTSVTTLDLNSHQGFN